MQSLNNYSKDELIKIINSLKKQKKFGLVWEDKPEKVATECEQKLPVLKEADEKAINEADDSAPTNIIIEGDNYHALSTLNYTHAGKIDVIYIDPPYNTGSKDFKYNDRFVDKEDSFRHSKWLSFMNKRLLLAKGLLSPTGVLFISIDDNEFENLKVLCNSIFGEENTDVMIWRKSGVGRDGKMKNTTTFRKDHEYIIVCFRNEKLLNKIIEIPNFTNEYNNADNDPRGEWMSGSLSRSDKASNPNHENYYSVVSPSGRKITRQFEISKKEFNRLNADNRISWGKNGNSIPRVKVFINEKRQITPYSLLLEKGTTTEGTKELNTILNGDYSNMRPKPTLLMRTLTQLASKENSIVLDFFAGSGTTGQAVLELNQEDGGNRQFILCTNNENQIAEDVTYPRIKTVVTGIREDGSKYSDGIPANIRYFKTDFVEKDETLDKLRRKLSPACEDMIRIREGAYEKLIDEDMLKVYKSSRGLTAIVYDRFELKEHLAKIEELETDEPIHLYVFSYTKHDRLDEIEKPLKHTYISQPIPEGVLEIYKRIFNQKGGKR